MFLIVTSLSYSKIVIIRTFFLYQPIQFYSTNATDLHHLNSHSTPCCPTT